MSIEIYHGDCLEVLSDLPSGSVDLVLTDPPYGTTAASWDKVIPFGEMWAELLRVAKPNAAILLHSVQPFTTMLIQSQLGLFRYSWVWNKGVGVNFFHVKRQPLKVTEDICVFFRKQPVYNPQMVPRDKPIRKSNNNAGETSGYSVDPNKYVGRVYEEAYPSVLLEFSSRSKGNRGLHPTQKPVELLEYLIKTYSNEDDLVLDFCMGSGSTGQAAWNTGRRFLGVEKDAKYYKTAMKRLGCQYT